MDGAVDASAAGQLRVGGVHQRIDLLLRDVSLRQLQPAWSELHKHGGAPSLQTLTPVPIMVNIPNRGRAEQCAAERAVLWREKGAFATPAPRRSFGERWFGVEESMQEAKARGDPSTSSFKKLGFPILNSRLDARSDRGERVTSRAAPSAAGTGDRATQPRQEACVS